MPSFATWASPSWASRSISVVVEPRGCGAARCAAGLSPLWRGVVVVFVLAGVAGVFGIVVALFRGGGDGLMRFVFFELVGEFVGAVHARGHFIGPIRPLRLIAGRRGLFGRLLGVLRLCGGV